jgi:hypothetical protein
MKVDNFGAGALGQCKPVILCSPPLMHDFGGLGCTYSL